MMPRVRAVLLLLLFGAQPRLQLVPQLRHGVAVPRRGQLHHVRPQPGLRSASQDHAQVQPVPRGALEAVATLFDKDAEWEGAYLGAMAMQALGISDPRAQEKAIAVAAGAGLEARTGTLKAIWAMKAEPERWQD